MDMEEEKGNCINLMPLQLRKYGAAYFLFKLSKS